MFMIDAGRGIVSRWAASFMRGIGQIAEPWSAILLTDMRKILAPIFVSHDLGSGFLPTFPRPRRIAYAPAPIATSRRRGAASHLQPAPRGDLSNQLAPAPSGGANPGSRPPCGENTAYVEAIEVLPSCWRIASMVGILRDCLEVLFLGV
jgi:hypothetical protein